MASAPCASIGAGLAGHALALARFHVEVGEAAQRLGAQLRIGLLQLEEAPVVFHRALAGGLDLLVRLHDHGARRQVADGLFLFLGAPPTTSNASARAQRGDDDDQGLAR